MPSEGSVSPPRTSPASSDLEPVARPESPAPDASVWGELQALFPDVPASAWPLLQQWACLMREWNSRINLVSRKDIDSLECKHLAHCLVATRFLRLMDGSRVLDVGTGGGLPGLPLAICYPHAHFTLVDSIGKKVQAVEAMRQELGLRNVIVKQARAETLKREFDLVTGRAVTRLSEFLAWIRGRVRPGRRNTPPNGVLYWAGGDLAAMEADTGISPRFVFPVQTILSDPAFAEKFIVHFDARDISRAKAYSPA